MNAAPGASGGAPYEATILVRGAPKAGAVPHVTAAPGAFGGAPNKATILVRVCRKWGRYRV